MNYWLAKYNKQIQLYDKGYRERWGMSLEDPPDPVAPLILMYIIDMLCKDHNTNILEVGCSDGYNLNFLSSIGHKNLNGVDLDEESINRGKQKYEHINLNYHDLNIMLDNIEKPQIIFSKSVFMAIPPVQFNKIIDNLVKIIDDDGWLVIHETSVEGSGEAFLNGIKTKKSIETLNHLAKEKQYGVFQGSPVFLHPYVDIIKQYNFETYFFEKSPQIAAFRKIKCS